jgi:hypothetical protein
MEGLERSPELRLAGTAVKHSSSCILAFVFVFQVGLASNSAPYVGPCSPHCVRFFDSAQPLTVLYSKPSELLDSCPKQVEAKRNNASGARQLSLPVDASTWCWPPKDGQPEWTLAT